MQPKTANGIISKAQSMHFDRIASSMTDAETKQTFAKFLSDNKVDGSINDRSRIVGSINRMDDPSRFFTSASKDPSVRSIAIGGRKGKTVILSDQHGFGQRVRPNEFEAVNATIAPAVPGNQVSKGVIANDGLKSIAKSCFDREPDDVELNGNRIFEGLDDSQRKLVNRKLGGAASCATKMALDVAREMGYKTLEEYLDVFETVAALIKGKPSKL